VDNENWIVKLYEWADKNNIPDLEYIEDSFNPDWSYYKGLPRDKEKLLHFTCLNLSKNNIAELPKEIGKLTSLVELNLYTNKLQKLPAEIGNLKNLTKLDLGRNQLTKLPQEIGKLSSLERFDVMTNHLKELPSEIGELKQLLELVVGENEMVKLPKEIGKLHNLVRFECSGNYIGEVPKEIGDLHHLEELHLPFNNLKSLPKELGKLTNLLELSLQLNPIVELPKEIKNLGKLKHFFSRYLIDGVKVFLNNRLLESKEKEDVLIAKIEQTLLKQSDDAINLDLEDIKMILQDKENLFIGQSEVTSLSDAIDEAFASLLFNADTYKQIKGLLVKFNMHSDFPMLNIGNSMNELYERIDADADIIWGTFCDDSMQKDDVQVIVMATF